MKTIYGWGINDAGYSVSPRNGGKRVECPFYAKWRGMIARVHCEKRLARNPTYRGVRICEEWRRFSNFAAWLSTKEWSKELDKDLISGVLYSPNTCLLVSKKVNYAIAGVRPAISGKLVGVHYNKEKQKYQAICTNFSGRKKHLGYFLSEEVAHGVWRAAKLAYLNKLADAESNLSVSWAIRALSRELQTANRAKYIAVFTTALALTSPPLLHSTQTTQTL